MKLEKAVNLDKISEYFTEGNMILYVNACVRSESRTDRIARALLEKLGEYEEVKLTDMGLEPLNEERLNRRTKLLSEGSFDDSMFDLAKQFASADTIVISAPLWDGSFPSVLKVYVENIYVTGIVSKYGEDGVPVGLCKADKLYYVTTSGGPNMPGFGYGYFEALAKGVFGIGDTKIICAENLDIFGNNPEAIVAETINNMSTAELS